MLIFLKKKNISHNANHTRALSQLELLLKSYNVFFIRLLSHVGCLFHVPVFCLSCNPLVFL